MKHLILLLLSFNAFAVSLSGEPPTQREDNSPFDVVTELKGFNVYCGIDSGIYSDTWNFIGYTLPRTTWTIPLATGVHYCVVTTIDTGNRESMYSNEVVIRNFPPNPPTITYPASADFNNDGIVNGLDIGIFKAYFGK